MPATCSTSGASLGGGNVLLAEGSVHFLRYLAEAVLPDLATRAGGESVRVPE